MIRSSGLCRAPPAPPPGCRCGPREGRRSGTGSVESAAACTGRSAWGPTGTRRDVGSKSRDSLNHPISLKVPVNPPYLKPPEAPINDLGLPKKEYYTTGDLSKVLNIKPDTLRYRFRKGYYPEPKRVGGKRQFTEAELKDIINISKMKKE